MTARYLCSAVFVQGQPADDTFAELVRPLASVAAPLLSYSVDYQQRSVSAQIAGQLFQKRAVWRSGYGCRLVHGAKVSSPTPVTVALASDEVDDGFAPARRVEAKDPRLAAALDQMFTEPETARRQVKAVVIVVDGRVFAERYAPGFDVDTPLMSFSVAKSVTNALAGVLAAQGRLDINEPIRRPEWLAPGDPRGAITANHLLRMQSGLNAVERGNGFDPVTHMLMLNDDMAGFAAKRQAHARPGTRWDYSSVNTVLLTWRLGEIVGGGEAGMRQFAQDALFAPLGMRGVTLEFDGSGTFIGSTFVHAPARSYARLGLLYLNDGVSPDGRRLLAPGWVAYSRRRTADAPYGAGFWLAQGDGEDGQRLRRNGFPPDGFYAWGALGQRIYILPGAKIVMARFGYSHSADHEAAEDMAVLRAAIAAAESVRQAKCRPRCA